MDIPETTTAGVPTVIPVCAADAPAWTTPAATLPEAPVAASDRDGTPNDADHRPTGRIHRSAGEWIALAALLVVAGAMYLWNLAASGWANSFYAAAVQAGTQSWKAFLFGASDAGASITVDKPPASLWVMALSGRIFGFSSWSMLAPQALLGVGTVAVVYAAVRRRFQPVTAIAAGAIMALTPVAALMFKYNNPDALLVFLLALATYFVLRAIEDGRTRWMVFAGVAVGFAFLTKQLQAFLVLPAFALAYLWAAPVSIGRRIRDGLLSVAALVVSAGWWVALVELWPASSRPYIGGSTDNSFLNLTFGYNGFGRITGNESGFGGGGGFAGGGNRDGGMFGGSAGLGRLFAADTGGQASWLLPAALALLVVGLVVTARYTRTSATRAAFVIWGGSLLVTAATFSFMSGIFHQYYTVALAPSIAALTAMGGEVLWTHRRSWGRWVFAAVVAGSVVWSFVLLGRSADWYPWLRWVVVGLGVVGVGTIAAGQVVRRGAPRDALISTGPVTPADPVEAEISGHPQVSTGSSEDTPPSTPTIGRETPADSSTGGLRQNQRFLGVTRHVGLAVSMVAVLLGPAAYTVQTVVTPHAGSIMTAGPTVRGAMGGFGGQGWQGFPNGMEFPSGVGSPNGMEPPNGTDFPSGTDQPNGAAVPGGTDQQNGTDQQGGVTGFPGRQDGTNRGDGFANGGFNPGNFGGGAGNAGPGGLFGDATTISADLKQTLTENASSFRWIAATNGSQSAAPYQLATGYSVMPIGGFTGSDPSPTLDQFKQWVTEGKIHYYIAGGGMGGGRGGGQGSTGSIATWVEQNFTSVTVDNVTLYDLTKPTSG